MEKKIIDVIFDSKMLSSLSFSEHLRKREKNFIFKKYISINITKKKIESNLVQSVDVVFNSGYSISFMMIDQKKRENIIHWRETLMSTFSIYLLNIFIHQWKVHFSFSLGLV